MTTKARKSYEVDPKAAAAMAELLAGSGNDDGFDFDSVNHNSVGRLASECARHRLLVSFWYGVDDHSFNLSIRAGEQRRSYAYYTAEELEVGITGLLKTLSGSIKRVK